jgi:hypothetical protein
MSVSDEGVLQSFHSLLYNGYWDFSAGGKARPGRDADHSPRASAEVINE